jgi:hypothetical protein
VPWSSAFVRSLSTGGLRSKLLNVAQWVALRRCKSSRVGILGLELIAELGMKCFWAGESGVHVEPEPHWHEISLLNWTGPFVKPNVVFLEDAPNAGFDLVLRKLT